MTGHDRFLSLMAGERVDRLPFDLPATPPIEEECERRYDTRHLNDAFEADFAWCWAGPESRPDRWRAAYAEHGVTYPESASVDAFGVVHLRPDRATLGAAWHLMEMAHPLAGEWSLAEVEALPWPVMDVPAMTASLAPQVREAHARGRAAAVQQECTVFELAWYLRGMDDLFMDLATGEGPSEWLLDWMMGRSIAVARASGAAGVDLLGLGDDVGTQRGMLMAPDQWRAVLKPRLARVIAEAKAAGIPYVRYHSDGNVALILDDLIEIGVDILNPVQPECMDWQSLASQYGGSLGFFGMIGTQTTMPFGSVDEVRTVVEALNAGHRDHGFRLIVAPTHVLEPDVPWANIEALVSAIRAGTGGRVLG